MSSLKRGLDIQDRLIGYLSRHQFDITHDETLDHEFKIDFVIRRFPGNPKFHSLGVQVTTRTGDLAKMSEFASVHSTEYRVVDKVVYLEVDAGLDFEKGVGHLIVSGLSEFQFNTAHRADKMTGLKINPDMTYSTFDVAAMLGNLANDELASRTAAKQAAATPDKQGGGLSELPKPSHSPVQSLVDVRSAANALQNSFRDGPNTTSLVTGKTMMGFINAYYRNKDHGFITAQDGESYFFGLSGVSDGLLRDRLLALPALDWAASVEGTVEFLDVGKTRPNARYAEAKGVKLAK